MFLTRDDIKQLTGAARRHKQIRELDALGIRFIVTLAGEPKVLHAEVDRVMLGGPVTRTHEPRFDLINVK